MAMEFVFPLPTPHALTRESPFRCPQLSGSEKSAAQRIRRQSASDFRSVSACNARSICYAPRVPVTRRKGLNLTPHSFSPIFCRTTPWPICHFLFDACRVARTLRLSPHGRPPEHSEFRLSPDSCRGLVVDETKL